MSTVVPREIKPELVEIGDTISVTFPRDGGLTVTHVGRVAKATTHGKTRYLITAEGATVLAWEPTGNRVKIILLKREPVPGETLFEMSDNMHEIRVRIDA